MTPSLTHHLSLPSQIQLIFPPSLTPRQRAIIHSIGEQHSLYHESNTDEQGQRRITLGRKDAATVTDITSLSLATPDHNHDDDDDDDQPTPPPLPSVYTDDDLIKLIQQHLTINASDTFILNKQQDKEKKAVLIDGSIGVRKLRKSPKQAPSTPHPLLTTDNFIRTFAPLLQQEHDAEVAQAEETLSSAKPESSQAKGLALLNLRLRDAEGGLLGRTLLTLVNNKGAGTNPLPPHKITPHDLVRIRPNKADSSSVSGGGGGGGDSGNNKPSSSILASGIVFRIKEDSITVAVDEMPDTGLDVPLKIEKMANEVTHKRLMNTLHDLDALLTGGGGGGGFGGTPSQSNSQRRCTAGGRRGGEVALPLIDVLFGKREPHFDTNPMPWTQINPNLDESQIKAVSLALAAKDVALIHGPPGTGKTTTVIETIAQEVRRGNRVLACAASNVAVDNLVERLVKVMATSGSGGGGITTSSSLAGSTNNTSSSSSSGGGGGGCGGMVVRIGHPARLLPGVVGASLEARVLRSDNSALAKDCRKEIKSLNSRILKLGRGDGAERRKIRAELKLLVKEERKREDKAIEEVLSTSKIICCTLSGIGSFVMGKLKKDFDVVFIDEAAQAIEPACWQALLKGRKAVLAGDHLQLPPTIISEQAAKGGLSYTLFERLYNLWGQGISEMLTVQYRMNKLIGDWSSGELYEGKLVAHPSVAQHTLRDLLLLSSDDTNDNDLPVLLLIDTAGFDMDEYKEEDGGSLYNQGEVSLTLAHVEKLMKAGILAEDIGIITPYNAQVGKLRELRPDCLTERLEISTVDGFQGREKEAIVISMVRSNPRGEVGFLSDARRMNVAVTRARRHCCLICDSSTVEKDEFLGRLVRWFEDNGELMSAGELVDC